MNVTPHQPDCAQVHPSTKRKRYTCSGTFQCRHCKRRVGYCYGMFDNMPEACDDCWAPPANETTQANGEVKP